MPSSTSTWRTLRPSGPLCLVTRTFPNIVFATSPADPASVTTTPPTDVPTKRPLPRPPAWIFDLTTTFGVFNPVAIACALSGASATWPSGTGTPNLFNTAFAWYSWIFTEGLHHVPELRAAEDYSQAPLQLDQAQADLERP